MDDVAVEILRYDFLVLAAELGQANGVVLEGLQQADHRPAALLQLMTIMLRAQCGRHLEPAIEAHVAHRGPEPLQDDRRIAPLAGGAPVLDPRPAACTARRPRRPGRTT